MTNYEIAITNPEQPMSTFTFVVDPSNKEIVVEAATQKEGHQKAWESLSHDERDIAASLECVEVE